MKWITISGFTILFGLFSAFVTSKVFAFKGGSYLKVSDLEKKTFREMMIIITISSFIAGMFWYSIIDHHLNWYTTGIFFGITSTLLTPFLLHLVSKWQDLVHRPVPGLVVDTQTKFLREFFTL
jgi:MFS superfamily sulfate permease-like transporter